MIFKALRRIIAGRALAGLFALLVLVPVAAHAALDSWEPYPPGSPAGGPWGGSVRRLLPAASGDPNSIWAATGGGIFKTEDGGSTWSSRNSGLASLDVMDIAFAASEPSVLLASTRTGGLYKSIDGGFNWSHLQVVSDNVEVVSFKAVAIDPANHQRLFAGSNDMGGSNSLFESSNGGTTWTKSPGVTTLTRITCLRFTTDGTRTLFVGGYNRGATSAAGRVFRYDLNNPPALQVTISFTVSSAYGFTIEDMALPGGDGLTLAVAAGRSGVTLAAYNPGTGLYDWISRQRRIFDANNEPISAYAIGADPAVSGRYLAYYFDDDNGKYHGLYATLDGFATAPTKISEPEKGMFVNSILCTENADFLAENISGVYRRTDKGLGLFSHQSRGMTAYPVTMLDFAPTGSNATGGGHALSVSGGGAISLKGNAGIAQWNPAGGGSWSRRSGEGAASGATDVIKYQTDTTLWMSVSGFTFYKSTDSGATWNTAGMSETENATNKVYSLDFATGSSSILMGGSGAIYYSLNGGSRWTMATGLPTADFMLAPDIGNYGGYFAASKGTGSSSGVFKTLNFGVAWTRADGTYFNDKQLAVIASSEVTPGHLLAGSNYLGLYESLDSGATWTLVDDGPGGLPLTGRMAPVALGTTEEDILAAVNVYGDGVYLTGDGGATWIRVVAGLELADLSMPEVMDLKFAPDGKSLIAGIDGKGLYSLSLGSMPVITNSGPFVATAQRPFSLALTGSDPDGSPLTFSAIQIPVTAAFSGNTMTWTPSSADIGVVQLVFAVSDGFYNRPYTFDLTVISANDPPVFDIVGDQQAVVGQQFTLTVNATDPDNGPSPVSYSAANMPAGAAMNGATFTWTPLPFQAGGHTVKFLATDGRETTSMMVAINANTPPVMQHPGDANGKLKAVKGAELKVKLVGHDADPGDRIFFWADGALLAGDTYSFTPTAVSQVKNVTLTVQDSRLLFGNTVNLTIETDPVEGAMPLPVFNYVPPQVVNVGDALTFTMAATDAWGFATTLEATGLPDGAVFTPSSGVFEWTPAAYAATQNVTFNAYQEGWLLPRATQQVSISVNRAPSLNAPLPVVGTVGSTSLSSVSATDPDSDTITYLADNLPPGASINANTGAISWAVQATNPRTTDSIIIAYDARGGYSSDTMSFTSNRTPTLSAIADKTVTVGSPLSFTVSGSDQDGDALAYSVTGAPDDASFNSSTGAFLWTPSATTGSPFALIFKVTDAYGQFATRQMSITVTPKPKPPSGGGGGGGGCFITTIWER